MDLRKIKKLIELLEDSGLTEMEVSEGDNTIRLSRTAPPATVAATAAPPAPPAMPATVEAVEAVDGPDASGASNASGGAPGPAAESTAGQTVVSPLVGTFYDAPSPDAAPFVTVGCTVAVGDTLCLIEAMKTFNHIDADVAGVVTAVHKKNGEPVEYGEALFVISAGG